MNDIMFGEEDAKYIKFKSKKKVKKSKHKHIYDKYCVARINRKTFNSAIVRYCSICGKIDNMNFFPKEEDCEKIKKEIHFDFDNFSDLFNLKYI